MASIIKRKKNYSVVYNYVDENGETKQKWETWHTHKEALKRKAEIENQQHTGTDKKETVKSEKSKKNTAPQLKRKSGEAEKRTQGNIAARQTQNEGAADPTARRRRRPKRRPAAEHAGNNVGRTAAGGGDHEE